MALKRGITSFFHGDFHGDDRSTIPEFTFLEFKRVVFGVANLLRLSVSELNERSVTPNFHAARLDGMETLVTILGHSTYPLLAFAEPIKHARCQLHFVDCAPVATEISRLFPHVKILTADELNRKPTESHLANLDEIEIAQIKYWQPQSVGEIVFNWWD